MPERTDEPRRLRAIESPPSDDYDPHEQPGRPVWALQERQLLGAILRDPEALAHAAERLNGNDFGEPRHEHIWDAAIHLYARGIPVNPIAVADQLGRDLRRVGGLAELFAIHGEGVGVGDTAHLVGRILDHATDRRLAILEHRLAELRQTRTPAERLDLAQQALDDARTHIVAGVDPTDTPHPWSPVDLTAYLEGSNPAPVATVMARRDGKHLLYPGAVHSIAGEPGSGKSWVAIVAAAQQLELGHPVLYIDHEDRPSAIVARLLAVGTARDAIAAHLRYVRPETALDASGWAHVAAAAEGAHLAVIDGITEAMVLHGLETNSNDDAAAWLALLPNRLANLGCAVVQIDHVTKNTDTRGRYAIGAQHKLAGITGTAYKLVVSRPMARGSKGHAKLVIDKDKHGDVGPVGVTVADLHIDATDPHGGVAAWLDVPGMEHDEEGRFRPTVLMGRVADFVGHHPGVTLRGIRSGVRGKASGIDQAVECLIREGYLRVEMGPNRVVNHHVVMAFGDGAVDVEEPGEGSA